MLKFIIYEDLEEFSSRVQFIINKIAMNDDYEYKIHIFNAYNPEIEKIIDDGSFKKIYILDVEVPNVSGLELASRIREHDWDSIIIFLTSHTECRDDVFYSRLVVLDYIAKNNLFPDRLEETLRLALNNINKDKLLTFKYNQLMYRIRYDDINYIVKLGQASNSIIATTDGEMIEINMGLSQLMAILDKRFYRTHKSCIVNVEKIKKIDNSSDTITFMNGATIDLLSVRKKKYLINYIDEFGR